MKMHKRLLNRQNLKRFSHQGFVNSLTSNFISQKCGVQNFSQEKNRNFHAKFNAFLFRIYRPINIQKYNYFPNLQFEFGLPLFFLKMVQKVPEKHRLEIQLQNNAVSFVQFVNRNNYIHNNTQGIQTIQKYQPSIFESENSVNYFYKSELNLAEPRAWKGQSDSRKQNVPVGIDKALFNNIIRFTQNYSIPIYSEKLFINKFFRENRIFSEGKRFQNIMFNKQQIEALEIHKQTKTIVIRDILTMALRFSNKFNEYRELSLPSIKSGLPLKGLQQKQVQSMKLVPQSFIAGDNLPDLVHKKPAETVNEPKSETQIATVDQYTPFRMMRPQGIVESSTGNQIIDIDHLTGKVMDLLEQRLKTEQERRGIFI